MSFVDFVQFRVKAGDGGSGAVRFRKEKFVAYGGPSGGNGGAGGDVSLRADENVGTLLDFRYQKVVQAEDGQPGDKNTRDGRDGKSIELPVPVGTLVRDADSLELLADLKNHGDSVVIARGGRGGKGNAHFKTSTNQTPKFAQPGTEGEKCNIVLELKLLADVGIIGYPSVGKSTLISVISNARPKIAEYHFTTLSPNLGIVQWRDHNSYVVADIPGLIEGASEGIGLGHQFLRHVERCKVLLHMIEVTMPFEEVDDGRDPIADFEKIQEELAAYSPALAERPQIVALSKADLPWVKESEEELREYFEGLGHPFYVFSAVTREGLSELTDEMGRQVEAHERPEETEFTVPVPEPMPDDPKDAPDDDFTALQRLIAAEDLTIATGDD
jgi:GTP-binding protein